jgi:hypothetical protein
MKNQLFFSGLICTIYGGLMLGMSRHWPHPAYLAVPGAILALIGFVNLFMSNPTK